MNYNNRNNYTQNTGYPEVSSGNKRTTAVLITLIAALAVALTEVTAVMIMRDRKNNEDSSSAAAETAAVSAADTTAPAVTEPSVTAEDTAPAEEAVPEEETAAETVAETETTPAPETVIVYETVLVTETATQVTPPPETAAPVQSVSSVPIVAQVTASSQHANEQAGGKDFNYSPYLVTDGDYSTCWCEGVAGDGIGETLTIWLSQPCEVSSLRIVNGLCSLREAFENNNRVKECAIRFSGGEEYYFTLDTDYSAPPYLCQLPHSVVTEKIELEILSVYKGKKYDDTCISEIMIN